MQTNQYGIGVGVGLLIIRSNTVLLGKRIGTAHGHGEYAGVGGNLELGETFEECALRECAEEAGTDLVVSRPRFLCLTNIRRYANLQYVDIGMLAFWVSGEPINTEPEKVESWDWHHFDRLPAPLFACLPNYLNTYFAKPNYPPTVCTNDLEKV